MKLKYLAISGLVVCLALVSCKKNDTAANTQDELPQVKIAQVKSEEIPQSEEYSATVESDIKNNISPNTPMRITRILFDVGDYVAKGQVVAYLDNSSQNQLGLQINAQNSNIKAQDASIRTQEATVASYEAQLKNTQAEANRIAALYAAGGISQSDNDAAQLQVYVQEKALAAQKAQLSALKEQKGAQNAQLRVLESQNTVAGINNKLVSPVSGYVTARNYDNGDMYGSLPVLTIEGTSIVKILLNISEEYFASVKKGMPVDITLDAYPGESFVGKITLINPSIDATTHTFQVEVNIQNTAQKVRPGMFARATINFDYQNHVVVPDEALVKQIGAGDRYVYVYNPSTKTVSYNKVELGKHIGSKYEIKSGVNPYDQVVIAGQSRLSDGKKVKVVK